MSLLDERGDRYMRARANRGGPRAPKTGAEVRRARNLYWLGLYTAGLTYEAISQQSGFSIGAVFNGIHVARSEGKRRYAMMAHRETD